MAYKFDTRLRACDIASLIPSPVNTTPSGSITLNNCGTAVSAPTSTQKVLDKSYAFTSSGNIQTVTDSLNSALSESAAYDGRDNLKLWSNSSGSSETYTIDPWGCLEESGTQNFGYPCNSLNQVAGTGYVYDNNGQMVQDGPTGTGGHTYAYDVDGNIATMNGTAATYTYDGEGNRVRKDYAGPTGRVKCAATLADDLYSVAAHTSGSLPDNFLVKGFLGNSVSGVANIFTSNENPLPDLIMGGWNPGIPGVAGPTINGVAIDGGITGAATRLVAGTAANTIGALKVSYDGLSFAYAYMFDCSK
jgi:hypothetical protein